MSATGYPPNLDQIQQLVSRARQLSATGQLEAAKQQWQAILTMLASDAPERRAVQREIDRLDARLNPKPKVDWRKRLGPFGVVLAFLAKFKTAAFLLLTKGKFLLSILAFVGVYWAFFGWWFAVGLALSVLMHEMGHYVVIRLLGLKAELPMFLPGFGAYVRWQGGGVDAGARAQISLAGPLFGLFSGLLAYGVYTTTHQRVWLAVAQVAGWMNLLNLIPIGFFDGGKAMDAIGQAQRVAILALSVAMCFVIPDGNTMLWIGMALATAYRLWKRDAAEPPHEKIGYYFIALAICNGLLSWYCMNQARAFMYPGGHRGSLI